MAPKALLGRYKLYKAGTKKLINWLASSAGRCSDLKSIIKSLGCGLPCRPSKKSQRSGSGSDVSITIPTQELLKLAEAIAASDPPVEIPESIIQIAKDVIAGREECAEWYAAQALQDGGELENENESHRYFIMSKRKPPQNPTKGDQLENLFACLELEEPSLKSSDSDSPGDHKAPPTPPPPYYKLEEEDDDVAFKTWCFLQDLNDVRSFVRDTWLEYSKGELSFLAASSITDTAFGLLRCADEEFAKSVPTDWSALLRYFGITWFTRERAVWLCPAKHGSVPRSVDSKMNIVELLCPIAVLCLLSYSTDAGAVCEKAKRERLGQATSDTPEMPLHRFHDFACVMAGLASEIHDIAHTRTCEHIVVDEFVQGLAQMHRTGKSPMWVVVACQIYLDIYDMLGTNISHGVEALQETLRRHKHVAENVNAYRTECATDMVDLQDALQTLEWAAKASNRFEESVAEGSVAASATGHHAHTHGGTHTASHGVNPADQRQLRIKQELGCSASAMERQLPAHAGAILADLKIGMHSAGVQIANYGCILLSMAHLYKALRAAGILKTDWHDMDFILASFGNKQPLVPKAGALPDADAAVRHYLMALGVSVTDITPGGRKTAVGSKSAPREARKITITSPFLQAMSNRQQSWEKHGLGYSKSKTVEIVLQTIAQNGAKSQSARRGSQLRQTFTPQQLLATFKRSILADEPQLNFDYTTFTIACARLLQTISEEVGPQLGLDEPGGADFYIPLVSRLLRSSSLIPATKPTTSTADILREHIAVEGKKFVKLAYDQTSQGGSTRYDVHVFDYSDTKYTFSGRTMAAYHAKVKPELCTKGCCGKPPPGGETDPNRKPNPQNGRQPIVAFGSAIPSCIIDASLSNLQRDPKKYTAAKDRMVDSVFSHHAQGRLSEQTLREKVRGLMCGWELVAIEHPEDGETPWSYRIQPHHQLYDEVFRGLMQNGYEGEGVYGSDIVIAVDALRLAWQDKQTATQV
ncbi:hypothetical protein LTR85_010814 [Meristemomyces frigidus]|nr:hypothetical protein LTR85_010814 [Meristemomyces frigidus]